VINMQEQQESFPEHHIWDLKQAISKFIVPRLKAYIQKVEEGDEMNSIPNWIEADYEIEGKSLEEKNKLWAEALRKMLFAFEYVIDPSTYEHLSMLEINNRREKGLALFAKYFDHLWD